MKLRKHQEKLRQVVADSKSLPLDILADVVPGGGKSMLPGILCQRFPDLRLAWFVPRLSLARQAAESLQRAFGIEINEAKGEVNPCKGSRGFVTTHAALTTNPQLWEDELRRRSYILVFDELHHAKIEPRDCAYSQLARALSSLPYSVRLCMTGTLETNDRTLIYGVPYQRSKDARGLEVYETDLDSFRGHVVRYSRPDAIAEGAVVPVEFHYHDGDVQWEDANGVQARTLSEVKTSEEGAAIYTALRTDLADQLFDNCVNHWRSCGQKLLVVTSSQATAREYAKKLRALGIDAGLAITDVDESQDVIQGFRRDPARNVLVTCQMAYEGLDVPAITHIACLTHIRSTPWIEQMLARAWRSSPGKMRCYAFVPRDPRMMAVVERIRDEQDEAVRIGTTTGGGNSGSGGDPAPVVAINGEVRDVFAELLDGGALGPADDVNRRVAEVCKQFGGSASSPAAMSFASYLRSAATVVGGEERTLTERKKEIRDQINAACRSADARKFGDKGFGAHNKILNERMGYKSLESMTLEELTRARTIAARICAG